MTTAMNVLGWVCGAMAIAMMIEGFLLIAVGHPAFVILGMFAIWCSTGAVFLGGMAFHAARL